MAVFFKQRGTFEALIKTISSYSCGESIFLNINNELNEFIVIRQVNPDSKYYDSTCNGTWIIKKDPIENITFNEIDEFLNETFLETLDNNLIDNIKQVNLFAGNDIINTRCFIASAAELNENFTIDGSKIYCDFPLKINSWTRTNLGDFVYIINENGEIIQTTDLNEQLNIYPILILSYNTPMFKKDNTFAGGVNI